MRRSTDPCGVGEHRDISTNAGAHLCTHGRGGLSRRSLEPAAKETPAEDRPTVTSTHVEVFDQREFRLSVKRVLSSIGDDGSALVASMDLLIAPPTTRENS